MSNFKDLLAQSVQINRHFYYGELMRRAKELTALPKGNNSRKFRRFLENVLVPTTSFSFEGVNFSRHYPALKNPVLMFPALLLDSELDTDVTDIPQIAQDSLQAFLRAIHKRMVFDDRLAFDQDEIYAETDEMIAILVAVNDGIPALGSNVFSFGVFYGFKHVDLATAPQAVLLSMVRAVGHIADLMHAVTEDLPRSMTTPSFIEGPFFVTDEDQEAYDIRQGQLAQDREDRFLLNLDRFLSR